VNEITGGKPIHFKDGRPDFSEWSEAELEFGVGVLDGSNKDFGIIQEELKKQAGLKNKKAARDWLKEHGYTPHHLSYEIIQFVPTKLHSNVPHIGTVSDMRRGKNEKGKF